LSWGLAVLALIPGLLFVVGDIALDAAVTSPPLADGTASHASTAESLLSPWPTPAGELASIAAAPYETNMPEAIRWEEAAVARDSTNPLSLLSLAAMQAYEGNLPAANSAASAAVANQPWFAAALDMLGAIEWNQGREAGARQLFHESLGYFPNQQLIQAYLSGQCVPILPGSLGTHGLAIGCGQPGTG
jgi:hypothetical protein